MMQAGHLITRSGFVPESSGTLASLPAKNMSVLTSPLHCNNVGSTASINLPYDTRTTSSAICDEAGDPNSPIFHM